MRRSSAHATDTDTHALTFFGLISTCIVLAHFVGARVHTVIGPSHLALPMHCVIAVIAIVDFTCGPSKRPLSHLFVILKHPFVDASICLLIDTLALKLSIYKGAFARTTSSIPIYALTFDPVLNELSCVALPIVPGHGTLTMHLVFDPVALVVTCPAESHPSETISFILLPLAIVERTIWPLVGSLSIHFVLDKMALVYVSLGHFVVADAIAVTIIPLTFVTASIRVPHLAIALSYVM